MLIQTYRVYYLDKKGLVSVGGTAESVSEVASH